MAPGRDMVVVAASAGGLQPLRSLLGDLPPGLPAALFVVLHVPATGGRSLPYILDRAGLLPASAALDGEPIRPGRVYVDPVRHRGEPARQDRRAADHGLAYADRGRRDQRNHPGHRSAVALIRRTSEKAGADLRVRRG